MTYAAFPSETDPPLLAAIKATSIWKDETICAYVRKLWEDHSASEICNALSTDLEIQVSRNAVVGWLFRQNLTIKQKTKIHPMTNGTVAPRSLAKPKPNKPKPLPRPKQIAGEPFVMRCAEVEPRHISLEQLTSDNCHYPYGDGPFSFCGNVALKGHSYCPGHYNLTHKPGR